MKYWFIVSNIFSPDKIPLELRLLKTDIMKNTYNNKSGYNTHINQEICILILLLNK